MAKMYVYLGCRGAGKNYKAEQLVDAEIIAMADPLRAMAWAMLGWTPASDLEYEQFKQSDITYKINGETITTTGRQYLQNIGSYMKSIQGEDYWTNQFLKEATHRLAFGKDIAVTDVRFSQEIESILSLKVVSDVYFIFSDYHSDRYCSTDTHISERLAQTCLKLGFKDGQLLSEKDIELLLENSKDIK